MADLLEGQFECQGIVFGEGTDYIVSRFTPGTSEIQTTDADRPNAHGIRLGRDYRGGSSWTWDVTVNTADETQALVASDKLATAWRSAVNLDPGESVPLAYRVAGRTRRVYGRPRRHAPADPTQLLYQGRQDVTMDFTAVDDLYYDDEPQMLSVNMVATPQGGFTFPITFPLSMTAGTGQREGQIFVTGTARSPLEITFHGPSINPSLELLGYWKVGLDYSIPTGQSLRVAAGPPQQGVFLGDAPLSGVLTRSTPSLNNLTLPYGLHEFVYRATDATNGSYVTVVWHNAHNSL